MSQASMREVAVRVFSRELSDATHTFTESDEERAAVYVLLPTGGKANRVFVVGTLTETEDLGDETEYWRGRVVDPVSTFFVYAGQYQPEAAGMLRDVEPPAFVAVVGKPRTFETDSGTVNVSIQAESITVVDKGTRNRWVMETAARTIDRIERFDEPDNEYARMAREQYELSRDPYRQDVIEAVERLEEPVEVAADTEEAAVGPSDTGPAESVSDERAAESESDEGAVADEEEAGAVDAEVIATYLQVLGGGNAVGRETLITAVCDDFDATADDVEAAIEEALGSGRCFRSGEDELTPI